MSDFAREGLVDRALPSLSVTLSREDIPAPEAVLPAGYRLAYYADGDGEKWADIHMAVKQFDDRAAALACFEREFPQEEERYHRMYFVYAPDGVCVGTATAWMYPDGRGRVHWVAVQPAHRGRGIARALVCQVIERLRELNPGQIWLVSGTRSHAAIRMYESLGFVRIPGETGGTEEAWDIIRTANEGYISGTSGRK